MLSPGLAARTSLAILALVCFDLSVARADEVLPPPQAMQRAIAGLKSALLTQSKDLRFALTAHVETAGGEPASFEYRYDPGKPAKAQWTLVHPTEAENAKLRKKLIKDHQKQQRKAAKTAKPVMQPDQMVIVRHLHEIVVRGVQFLREDGDSYIFSYDPGIAMLTKPGKPKDQNAGKEKDGKRQQKMAKALHGEFAISRDGKQFLWIRQFSVHSFKPASVAKINHFELLTQFAPAWPGGPLVQTRQASKVSGSALFKTFDQSSTVTYSDFVKR